MQGIAMIRLLAGRDMHEKWSILPRTPVALSGWMHAVPENPEARPHIGLEKPSPQGLQSLCSRPFLLLLYLIMDSSVGCAVALLLCSPSRQLFGKACEKVI